MEKKITNGQLQRRLKNALVHIDKTKETKSVFFEDKGLRVTVNDDVAIIETGYHRHIFNSYTASGVCMPWLYMRRLVDIALENECVTYGMMQHKLKEKENDKNNDYNFVIYVSWWLFNIFQPLYSIGNTDTEMFLVYEEYMHNIARNTVLLSEKESDLTNHQFVSQVTDKMMDFIKDTPEEVFFKKKTDEEIIEENINAEREQEMENFIQEQQDESKDKEA